MLFRKPWHVLAATSILATLALSAGCGGGGGGGTVGGGGFVFTPPGNTGNVPLSPRTFTVSNWNAQNFATVVSTSVGTSEGDTTTTAGDTVTGSARVGRDLPPDRQQKLNLAARVALRQGARPSLLTGATPYDTTTTFNYVLATDGTAHTLFNRTPGVNLTAQGGTNNAGTKPTHCIILVEGTSASSTAGDAVSAAQIASVVQAWEVDNPFNPVNNSGIYNTDHTLFGLEWGANGLGGGGEDGDPRVVLAFIKDQASEPGLFGFFSPVDELGPAGSVVQGETSNGGEILYLVASHFNGDQYEGLATMAHEFQHMISFNNKIARQGTFPANAQPEQTTVDEGLAVLGEEDNGFSINAITTSQGNPGFTPSGGDPFKFQAVSDYLANPSSSDKEFFAFSNFTSDYGKGFLMMKHIQDHFGGAGTILNIDQSTQVGIANLQAQTGSTFANLEHTWGLTNLCSGLNGAPSQFLYHNLDLYGTFVDETNNGGLVGTTVQQLSGPGLDHIFNPSGSQTVNDLLGPFLASYVGMQGDNASDPTLTVTVNEGSNVTSSLVVQDGSGTIVQVQQ